MLLPLPMGGVAGLLWQTDPVSPRRTLGGAGRTGGPLGCQHPSAFASALGVGSRHSGHSEQRVPPGESWVKAAPPLPPAARLPLPVDTGQGRPVNGPGSGRFHVTERRRCRRAEAASLRRWKSCFLPAVRRLWGGALRLTGAWGAAEPSADSCTRVRVLTG